MDFLDPNKHREHRRRLFISYFLVASVILMGSYLLFYQTKGFDVNRQTGKVIQNGLVYVSTSPATAQIYLNGQQLSTTTNTKLTIPEGVYGVELRSQGYRTWKGSINLEGGSVERLTYPLLIPETLKTTDVQLYSSSPGLTTSSPDRRWLLVQQPGSSSIFDNYDLSSFETPPTTLTLAPELLTSAGSDHTMTAIAWADDNRHILVRHDFAGGNEYVLLDREKIDLSVNLSRLINLPGNLVVLRDRHFDQYYVLDPATHKLQTYDLKAKTLRTLLDNILSFKTSGPDNVLYITDNGLANGPLGLRIWDGKQSSLMRTLAAGSEASIEISSYNGQAYAVLASKTDGYVAIYADPARTAKKLSDKAVLVPTTVLRLNGPGNPIFSDSGQFVYCQSGAKFAVYDIDEDRRHYFELKDLPENRVVNWMDSYRLTYNVGDRLRVVDFDGNNQQDLTVNSPAYKPIFTPDFSTILNIAPSIIVPGRPALTATPLKLK